jgi:hypothetical protein
MLNEYSNVTEYIDNISVGSPVTVTTKNRIVSGDVSAVDQDAGLFELQSRTDDKSWTIIHTGGKLRSNDDGEQWPQYEIDDGETTESVKDVRQGFYSLGRNPNLNEDRI